MRLLICTQAVDRNDPVLGFFHRWLEEFAKHCERVTVVCLRKGDVRLQKNVEVIALGNDSKPMRTVELLSIAWGRRHEYDAVFVHMNPEYIVAAGWLWKLLDKYVALWYVHRAVNLRLRVAMPFTDKVFTVEETTFGIPSPKVTPVGHGIDVGSDPVERTKSEVLRVVAVGRVTPIKRFEDMMDALDVLNQRSVAFSFEIVGDPATDTDRAYAQGLRSAMMQKPWAHAVRFAGSVPHSEIPKIMMRSDVLLSMTPTGSFDKAILEALNSGVLAICASKGFADAPGVRVVDPRNPEGVADAMLTEPATLDATRAYLNEHHSLTRLIAFISDILRKQSH